MEKISGWRRLEAGCPFLLTSLVFFALTATAWQASPLPDPGQVFLYNKDYRRAAAYYLNRIQKHPDSLIFHRGYQDACFNLNDSARQAVVLNYKNRVKDNPENADNQFLVGRCLDCQSAMPHYDRALVINHCHAWAHNGRGACYFESGNFRQAKKAFLKTIKCNPDFAEAYQNLAQVYFTENDFKKALKTFRKLLKRDRTNPLAYEWLGDLYLRRKNHDNAAKAYKKALSLKANGPAIYFKTGYTCFRGKDYSGAVKYYRESIKQGNKNFNVFYNAGSALELDNYPDEALDYYQKAYDLSGDYRTLYSIGNCAVMSGLYTKAIKSYKAFLKKEPEHPEALFGLANAYQIKKDYHMAVSTFEQVLALDSNFTKAYHNLGAIYAYHTKDQKKMRQYWGMLLKKFPNHEEAVFIRNEMKKMQDSEQPESL